MGLIVFDAIGTLIDLRPLASRLAATAAPEVTLDAWFERTLHHAVCTTLAGGFAPFADLALSALETTLLSAGADPSLASDVLRPFTSGSLPAYDDAEPALRVARQAGSAIAVLTNVSADQTEAQLRATRLDSLVDHVRSLEEVAAYKPHPSVYGLVSALDHAGGAVLVAAHAWDVLGARSAGLDAVWVRRTPAASWPFTGEEPAIAPDLTTAVRAALGQG